VQARSGVGKEILAELRFLPGHAVEGGFAPKLGRFARLRRVSWD
jgi:hypothetical protein